MFYLVARDLKKQFLNIHFLLSPLVFLLICSFIFGFALPDEVKENNFNGFCVIVSSCLLAFCLIINFIFEEDHKSGMLEIIFLNCSNKAQLIYSKILSCFLANSLGFVMVTPLLAVMFNIDMQNTPYLCLVVLCTCFLFSFISVMIASLMIGLKNGGILGSILTLPLFIPLLIINLSFLYTISEGNFDILSYLQNIAALCLIYAPLSVISAHYAVKSSMEEG